MSRDHPGDNPIPAATEYRDYTPATTDSAFVPGPTTAATREDRPASLDETLDSSSRGIDRGEYAGAAMAAAGHNRPADDELWQKLCHDLSLPPPGPADQVLAALSVESRVPVTAPEGHDGAGGLPPLSGVEATALPWPGTGDTRWLSDTAGSRCAGLPVEDGAESTDPLYWFAQGDKASLAELDASVAVSALALPDEARRRRAMAAALGACFNSLLPLFDPMPFGSLETKSGWSRLFGAGRRNGRLWRQYQQHYRHIVQETDVRVAGLFQTVFLPVYEQRLQEAESTPAAAAPAADITRLIPPVR